MEWVKSKISELIEDFERGISYSSADIESKSGIPMLNLACIDKSGFYRDGELKYYSGHYNGSDKVFPGDMLIACTDLTRNADIIGTPIWVPSDYEYYLYTMDLAKLTPKENRIDKKFLYYALKQKIYRQYIKPWANGTNVLHLKLNGVYNYELFYPKDLPTQQNIAGLLSALDAKISLCREMNTHLEGLARQIYQYWFLQFQYPNATQQLTYNPILKQPIPNGWEYITVDKLTNVATGKEDANFSTPNGQYPFFTCSKENLYCDKAAFSGKAILIAGNGDFNVKHYTGEFNAYQRTYVLIPNDPKYYGVLYFAAKDKIASFKAKSNGSIIKFITKGDIESIGIYECNHPGVYEQINTLLDRIEHNDKEITALTHQRDELLPLLMNGQVVLD